MGKCAIKHCGLICGKKEDESPELRQINIAIRAELAIIEVRMRTHMLESLRLHGSVLPIQVNQETPVLTRTLTVRVTNEEPKPDSAKLAEKEPTHDSSDANAAPPHSEQKQLPQPPPLVRQQGYWRAQPAELQQH